MTGSAVPQAFWYAALLVGLTNASYANADPQHYPFMQPSLESIATFTRDLYISQYDERHHLSQGDTH